MQSIFHFAYPVKLPFIIDKFLRAVAKFTRIIFKKEYVIKYSLLLSWYSSRILKRKMQGHTYDCVCAPAAATELSYFKTDLPVIYISDTTFKLLSHYYTKDFEKIPFFSKWEGNHLEKRSLKKSSLVIYSSQWAAQSAVQDYKVEAEKLFIMPFGANMDFVPNREVIYKKDSNATLTLLYLAVDWERKGGSIAFDALKQLHECCGVKAKLIVCGCEPPAEFSHPYMEVIPFLNKNKPEDCEKFISLLSSVHFLILPTRADCSLLVAGEANAYGVPAITTETGGVPDVVKDGINGYCVPYGANGWMYATLIAELFADKEKYKQLVYSSRIRFEEQLNWNKWADGFRELYETHILKNRA